MRNLFSITFSVFFGRRAEVPADPPATPPLPEALDPYRLPVWAPKVEGTTLHGIVEEIYETSNSYGSLLLYIIRTDKGQRYGVPAQHHVLREELLRQGARRGDRVKVSYHGPTVNRAVDRVYYRYRVSVIRRLGGTPAPLPHHADRDAERLARARARALSPDRALLPDSDGPRGFVNPFAKR